MKRIIAIAFLVVTATALGTALTKADNGSSSAAEKNVSTTTDSSCHRGQPCESCKDACKKVCSDCKESCTPMPDNEHDSAAKLPPATAAMASVRGRGHAGDSQHAKDHQDFFFLIEHREKIQRTIKEIPDGVETLTESDDPAVAAMIQTHVNAMYDRVEHSNPIRMRDPLFREVFANGKKIKMQLEHTDKGIRVKETSDDAYVVKLIRAHAAVVSLWIKNGYSELPKNHAAPAR
ncbi:hypothetical protein [Stieleria varia]|uniref:Uncharacterized protein n=1 Tax=Stieleria varia TaxID=2528005 RepID=A0A5C6BBF3_9BACT|nr:hypothetical protein [Stieleria varia]TWU08576.1 hypothetical protein Pla52n_11590 [Stieleria varia]